MSGVLFGGELHGQGIQDWVRKRWVVVVDSGRVGGCLGSQRVSWWVLLKPSLIFIYFCCQLQETRNWPASWDFLQSEHLKKQLKKQQNTSPFTGARYFSYAAVGSQTSTEMARVVASGCVCSEQALQGIDGNCGDFNFVCVWTPVGWLKEGHSSTAIETSIIKHWIWLCWNEGDL